jgi:hypothetical protein
MTSEYIASNSGKSSKTVSERKGGALAWLIASHRSDVLATLRGEDVGDHLESPSLLSPEVAHERR